METSLLTYRRRFLRTALFAGLSCCVFTGCLSGAIYQDITVPYSLDVNRTPVGDVSGQASIYRLQEPVTGANVSVEWNSYGLADALKQGNVSQAYIADLRRQSAVFGIWRRDTLIVNGRQFEIKEGALQPLPLPVLRQ